MARHKGMTSRFLTLCAQGEHQNALAVRASHEEKICHELAWRREYGMEDVTRQEVENVLRDLDREDYQSDMLCRMADMD